MDLIHSTQHEEFALEDYRALTAHGIATIRDGVRWHLIESWPGRFEFSSLRRQLLAAEATDAQVIWDLCHYGWPDDLDIFSAHFLKRFERFARAFARHMRDQTDRRLFVCPMNEISFLAWAGGDVGYLNPFATGEGNQLKRQLAKAAAIACEAVLTEQPEARLVHIDPLVHVLEHERLSDDERIKARGYNDAVLDGWAMVAGELAPELGGHRRYLDIIGVNYYIHNQWLWNGSFVEPGHAGYIPLSSLLEKVHKRFRRPLFIAETGIEDHRRPEWFRYVCDQAATAINNGVPVEGVCLYPIANHAGWDDDRHCHNGMFDRCDDQGKRSVYQPLADELAHQQVRFGGLMEARSSGMQYALA